MTKKQIAALAKTLRDSRCVVPPGGFDEYKRGVQTQYQVSVITIAQMLERQGMSYDDRKLFVVACGLEV